MEVLTVCCLQSVIRIKVKKLAVTGANLWPDTHAINPFAYNWAMNENATLRSKPQTRETKSPAKLARLLSYEPHIQFGATAHDKMPNTCYRRRS
jgi:hypothetical protein